MFSAFEKLLDPYPDGQPTPPPRGLFPFVWSCIAGARGLVLGMILLTASIGMFEAYLFSMLGDVVDWLARVEPSQLWTQERDQLLLLAARVCARQRGERLADAAAAAHIAPHLVPPPCILIPYARDS